MLVPTLQQYLLSQPYQALLGLPSLPHLLEPLTWINNGSKQMWGGPGRPSLVCIPTCRSLPEDNGEVIPLKLSQFQRVFLIAEIPQLKVHQALVQVGKPLSSYSKKYKIKKDHQEDHEVPPDWKGPGYPTTWNDSSKQDHAKLRGAKTQAPRQVGWAYFSSPSGLFLQQNDTGSISRDRLTWATFMFIKSHVIYNE